MASSPTSAALPPPPGVIPNLSNPESGPRTAFLAGNIICITVPTILVIFRVYVKANIVKDFRLADCALLIPLIRELLTDSL